MANDDRVLIEQWAKMYEDVTTDGTFKIEVLTDKKTMEAVVAEMYKLLVDAYKGNFLTARSAKDLLERSEEFKIARDSNGTIIACAAYRTSLGGNKMTSIGAKPGSQPGKEALKELIRSDIEPYDNWYWAEVSGPIEHYFKKLNGNPIPNAFAAIFLHKKPASLKLDEDGVHYTREIGNDRVPYSKMIFGFKSKDLADEVMKSVENYEDFRIEVNKLEETLFGKSSRDVSQLRRACMTINAIESLRDEWQVNELLMTWRDSLMRAMREIERSRVIDPELNKMAKACYAHAKYFLESIPVLAMRKFSATEALENLEF